MLKRTLLTFTTFAVLSALYGLYDRFVGELVRPQTTLSLVHTVVTEANDSQGPPVENVQVAQRHLPEWASNAKYQLRDSDGTFYYTEKWEELNTATEGAVRFTPFALVWVGDSESQNDGDDKDKKPKGPFVLTADSALIQLDSQFDPSSNSLGRVIGGQLEGSVQIQGENGLHVQGRNFMFREAANRVWSDNAVEFRYGPHRAGADGGIQIELVPAPPDQRKGPFPFAGIQKLLLRRRVSMVLVMDEDSDPVPVDVNCEGGFEYDLGAHIARFEKNVRVRRPTGEKEFDTLQCPLMTLLFEQRSKDGQIRGKPVPPLAETIPRLPQKESEATPDMASGGGAGNKHGDARGLDRLPAEMTFRRLLAEGGQVILTSDSNELKAHMTEFIYDAETRVAVLRSGEACRIFHRRSLLACPEVTITHNPDGKIVAAWCRGAGHLEHRDRRTGDPMLNAEWLTQMRLYPAPDSELMIVEMQDGAKVRQSGQNTGLSADLIQLWYMPEEKLKANATRGQKDPLQKNQPHHLLATGNVSVLSQQLEGQTPRLEVVFDSPPSTSQVPPLQDTGGYTPLAPLPLPARGEKSRPIPERRMERAASNPIRKTAATEPAETQRSAERLPRDGLTTALNATPATSPLSETDHPVSRLPVGTDALSSAPGDSGMPVRVASDAIKVRMEATTDDSRYRIAEVWNNGNVQISQEQKGTVEPFHLSGNSLHLVNRENDSQAFHVFGQLARVHHEEFDLEGPELFIDRQRNEAWVNGAGNLKLLVTSDLEGRQFETPQTLSVEWSERMTFDGQHAQFLGNVVAVLEHHRMHCHGMEILLTDRVVFTDSSPSDQEVQIRRVVCHDGVEIDSYGYLEGKLTEIRKARFGQFSLDHVTGATDALGPGNVQLWTQGRGKRAAVSPQAAVQANSPLEAQSAEWEYTQVEFSGNATGNVHQRQTTFQDRVRIVYGPVGGPLETVNADLLPKDAAEMQCDILEFLQQGGSDGSSTGHTELTARGNAKLEGRSFFARADAISFDESKGLYVLTSLGNREATIWRQTRQGGEYSEASAKQMRFVPSRNYLDFDRASQMHGVK